MPLEAGATLYERYQIVRPVTAGAMGSLYEAHDLRLDGPCAVKEMHATRDAWVYRRFKEEATLLSRLNHPDIPKVRDFFLIDDIGYIVMDFVRGSNLLQEVTARLKDGGNPFSSLEVRQLFDSMLGVVDYLHSLTPCVLHRDIKPSNIIREESSGRFILVDFGLARHLVGSTQTCAGTVSYCAPEQMQGQADERSDLFGLAATVYFLATGKPPRVGAPKPVLSLAPDLDPHLAALIDRSLESDPDLRFPSARTLREALTAAPKSPRRPFWHYAAGAAATVAALAALAHSLGR